MHSLIIITLAPSMLCQRIKLVNFYLQKICLCNMFQLVIAQIKTIATTTT